MQAIRHHVPDHVGLGISGDASAATALGVGCTTWYSALAGTLPGPALTITRAAEAGDTAAAVAASLRLQPLWDLFARFGSLRVTAAVAEHLGLVGRDPLPRPLRGLSGAARREVDEVVTRLDLGAGNPAVAPPG